MVLDLKNMQIKLYIDLYIKFSKISNEKTFSINNHIENFKREDWEKLNKEKYKKIFKNSAMKRAKYEGLIRNINLNSKD